MVIWFDFFFFFSRLPLSRCCLRRRNRVKQKTKLKTFIYIPRYHNRHGCCRSSVWIKCWRSDEAWWVVSTQKPRSWAEAAAWKLPTRRHFCGWGCLCQRYVCRRTPQTSLQHTAFIIRSESGDGKLFPFNQPEHKEILMMFLCETRESVMSQANPARSRFGKSFTEKKLRKVTYLHSNTYYVNFILWQIRWIIH